ncbi:hypothetical protein TNCV_2668031 [Trichonephila clavipes]|nr:hypothetical protein TNCV_2668031 [Trichonephila clavipes]
MYSWYTLGTVDLENPSSLMTSKMKWPMSHAPMICLRPKTSKSDSLPILAITTTNSEWTFTCRHPYCKTEHHIWCSEMLNMTKVEIFHSADRHDGDW